MIYTIATNLRCEKKGKFLLPFYAKYTLYGTIDNFWGFLVFIKVGEHSLIENITAKNVLFKSVFYRKIKRFFIKLHWYGSTQSCIYGD